jgi:2-iminobutanoate/2-iminopropanoate deaminase
MKSKFVRALIAGTVIASVAAPVFAAQYLGDATPQKERAYSRMVVTNGGNTVWLAGRTTRVDLQGNNIAGNFEAQTRTIFAQLDATLKEAGGSLADMVTMTVFITDPRFGNQFVEIRKEMFKNDNYPASGLITVAGLAHPDLLVEVQGVAVIGDSCSDQKSCVPKQ